ncbi:MAG TPA: transposase [Candidatus Latescibacteria bacterium]|nr:transposase [Candidatus Latescibacterota bacterium]
MSTRRYSPDFKAGVVLESLRGDVSQAELCRRYSLRPAEPLEEETHRANPKAFLRWEERPTS